MRVASQMEQLCAFVHVSTYYVRPFNSICEERIYPLPLEVDGKVVDHRCEGQCGPAASPGFNTGYSPMKRCAKSVRNDKIKCSPKKSHSPAAFDQVLA